LGPQSPKEKDRILTPHYDEFGGELNISSYVVEPRRSKNTIQCNLSKADPNIGRAMCLFNNQSLFTDILVPQWRDPDQGRGGRLQC
jgi:hypothetical protein